MARSSVITIGNYDGVHVGHRALLAHARQLADQHDAKVVVMIFDPHPMTTLRPGRQPPRLSDEAQRRQLLQQAGADEVVTLAPTPALLGREAEAFIAEIVKHHHPVAFVEGADFRFGRGRRGDVAELTRLGRSHGFEVIVEPAVEVVLSDHHAARISSSLVRYLVGHGRVVDAAKALGRPFGLRATVTRGEQRGRTIGVPTANLDPADYEGFIVPADGVYAGMAELADGQAVPAAISVGTKPTFHRHALVVEAHLLDFVDDLYGQTLTVRFARWLRHQYRFPNVRTLTEQMQRDIALTRRWHECGLLAESKPPSHQEHQEKSRSESF